MSGKKKKSTTKSPFRKFNDEWTTTICDQNIYSIYIIHKYIIISRDMWYLHLKIYNKLWMTNLGCHQIQTLRENVDNEKQ